MPLQHAIDAGDAANHWVAEVEADGGLAQSRVHEALMNAIEHGGERLFAARRKSDDESNAHGKIQFEAELAILYELLTRLERITGNRQLK